jgi:hypothetical protein
MHTYFNEKNYIKFEDDEGLGLPNLSVKKPSLTRVILYPSTTLVKEYEKP